MVCVVCLVLCAAVGCRVLLFVVCSMAVDAVCWLVLFGVVCCLLCVVVVVFCCCLLFVVCCLMCVVWCGLCVVW